MTAREFLKWAGYEASKENLYRLTEYVAGDIDYSQFPDACVVTQDGTPLNECAEEPALFQEWMDGLENWIELVKKVGNLQGEEVWQAVCHHDGYETEGWALVGDDYADFYDTDPRQLPKEYLIDGYRLPSYMPGERPEY